MTLVHAIYVDPLTPGNHVQLRDSRRQAIPERIAEPRRLPALPLGHHRNSSPTMPQVHVEGQTLPDGRV